MTELRVGKKFDDADSFEKHLEAFQKEKRVCFSRVRTSLPTCKKYEHLNIDKNKFPFYEREYHCYYGPELKKKKSKNKRKSKTSKLGCPVVVIVRFHFKKQCYIITVCNLNHSPLHDDKAYDTLPPVRRLPSALKEDAIEKMRLHCKRKMLQVDLLMKHGKQIKLKDLSNIRYASQKTGNEFSDVIAKLQANGADHAVFTDQKKIMKAIFFQTENMKRVLKLWPDLLNIDATYRLTNMNLALMLITVEDANSRIRVAGAGLLETEDAVVLNWFFSTFKNKNKEACAKIKNILTDKDHTQRSVLAKLFPDAKLLLCIYHTLQTFGRQITTAKLNISTDERNLCLDLLSKLTWAKSSAVYNFYYAKFSQKAPKKVVEYFEFNWHDIKEEWVYGFMQIKNYGNSTNNALEGMNAKIKDVVPLNSGLVNFFHYFFIFLTSQNIERNAETGDEISKIPSSSTNLTADEKKYAAVLTSTAWNHVQEEIESSHYITFHDQNPSIFECTTRQNNKVIRSTIGKCNCHHFLSFELPCKHIFATRKIYGQPLFSTSLLKPRWTKQQAVEGMANLKEKPQVSLPIGTVEYCQESDQEVIENSMKARANNLIFMGERSTGSNFEEKVQTLNALIDFWTRGVQVQVNPKPITTKGAMKKTELSGRRKILEALIKIVLSPQNISKAKLSQLQEIETYWKGNKNVELKETASQKVDNGNQELETITISDVVMPDKIVIQGKPRRGDDTFAGKRKATSKYAPNAKRRKV